MKSGFVSVVGRTNAGKSTLVNNLIGEKIAIVSNKPQTTRYRIMGVLNEPDCQIVFTDTPGIHQAKTRLGDYMNSQATDAMADTDVVLLVIEPVANVGKAEEKLIASLKTMQLPAILVINKIDTVPKGKILEIISLYAKEFDFDAVIPLSARKRDGIALLKQEIQKYMQEGPMFFPEDMITDSPIRQRIAEIIREKLLWSLEKEVPHGIAIEISQLKETETLTVIHAVIYCEKASHKGIIIGKNGELLKKIGIATRQETEKLLGKKVHLDLWVKIKEGWRDNHTLLKNFGFAES